MKRVAEYALAIIIVLVVYSLLSDEREPHIELTLAEIQAGIEALTYDDLARYPDVHQGTPVQMQGQILQKISDNRYRIAVTRGEFGFWTDAVYVRLMGDAREARLLEDDIVEFLGLANGTHSYIAVLGNRITIPRIDVYQITVIDPH